MTGKGDIHIWYRSIIVLGILLFLTGCVLPASSGPETPIKIQKSQPASGTQLRQSTQYLKPVVQSGDHTTLQPEKETIDFPLSVGNSWIYLYNEFLNQQEASWRVSDSVANVEVKDGQTKARILRKIEFLQGEEINKLTGPEPDGNYWIVTDGMSLYRMWIESKPGPNQLSEAWLELRFPFSPCWIPNPVQRATEDAIIAPSSHNMTGCRRLVSDLVVIETTDYIFKECYTFELVETNGISTLSFCSGVGIVEWGYIGYDGSIGYDALLSGYSINSP